MLGDLAIDHAERRVPVSRESSSVLNRLFGPTA